MQKKLYTLVLFLCFSVLFNQQIFSQTSDPNQLSGSWMVVDVQGLDGTELSPEEQTLLGNTWYFLPNNELVIKNESNTFMITYEDKGGVLEYLNRTLYFQEKNAYQIDLLDTYQGRKVLVSFRAKNSEEKYDDEIVDMRDKVADLNLSKYGFDFSFKPKVIDSVVGDNTVYKTAEEMPRFPGCEEELTLKERKQCATGELLKFIYKNVKYPAYARENKIEGTVVISFIVETDGQVSETKITRDIGGGCAEEALNTVNLMIERNILWIPGKQDGEAVRVQFNLPVKFKL